MDRLMNAKVKVLTVNAAAVGGAVDGTVGQDLEVSVLEEDLDVARGARDVAQVGGALRALRRGRGCGGARGHRQRRQEQAQRARPRAHRDPPRPWQPPRRRHCLITPLSVEARPRAARTPHSHCGTGPDCRSGRAMNWVRSRRLARVGVDVSIVALRRSVFVESSAPTVYVHITDSYFTLADDFICNK